MSLMGRDVPTTSPAGILQRFTLMGLCTEFDLSCLFDASLLPCVLQAAFCWSWEETMPSLVSDKGTAYHLTACHS